VDFERGIMRLDKGTTKNGEAHKFPIIPELAEVLEPLRRTATERGFKLVFCYAESGAPIRDFRGAWVKACEQAGIGKRLFHDFRRTAARALIRAGVSEPVAMDMLGHKTRSVFERYAITDETVLSEAGGKLAAHLSAESHTPVTMTLGEVERLAARGGAK
jgi:integrase